MLFPSAYTTEAAAGCCIQFDVSQQNAGFDKLETPVQGHQDEQVAGTQRR